MSAATCPDSAVSADCAVSANNAWSGRVRLGAWLLAAVVPVVWLGGPILWRGEVLAFRDAGNFYYPLFAWQSGEWRAGRMPLWDPLSGLGLPAQADATSSTFYPGKLLFLLPFSFAMRFNLYLGCHVVIAAAAAYWSARQTRCGPLAAALCAVAYSCSGSVLFQYCNAPFLIGASWFPVAITLADAMLARSSWRLATGCGALLALMVLGGDPQTAYHVMILATLRAGQRWWRSETASTVDRVTAGGALPPALPRPPRSLAALGRSFVLLAVAGLCGLALSAIQTAPSWHWTRSSDRASYDQPRNMWEAIELLRSSKTDDATTARSIRQGLFGRSEPNTHEGHIYDFSVGPWRAMELVWPNVTGRLFPVHQRWIWALPAECGVWTPSLYCGLLPLLLAVVAWRSGVRGGHEQAARLFVVVGGLASMGWYGGGWLVQELSRVGGWSSPSVDALGSPVGGLYWWLVVSLPGYAYFRYPAKWLIVMTWGICWLAGLGLERWEAKAVGLRRLSGALTVASLVLVILSIAGRSWFVFWLQNAPGSEIFGPLDRVGAWWDLLRALLHGAIVGLVGFALASCRQRMPKPYILFGLLATTVVELLVAQGPLIGVVPARLLASRARARRATESSEALSPLRIAAEGKVSFPPEWRVTSDRQRLASFVAWQSAAFRHKLHLLHDVASPESLATCNTVEFRSWLNLLSEVRRETGSSLAASLLGAVNVSRLAPPLLDAKSLSEGGDGEWGSDASLPGLDQSTANPAPLVPRAWIVHRVESIEVPTLGHRSQWRELVQRSWLSTDRVRVRDPRSVVTVARSTPLPMDASRDGHDPRDRCTIVGFEPLRIQLEASLATPGLLVISEAFDAGWQVRWRSGAAASWEAGQVERVNGLLRGVFLPAGAHRVEFQYRPPGLAAGGAVTVLAGVLLSLITWRSVQGSSRRSSAETGRLPLPRAGEVTDSARVG